LATSGDFLMATCGDFLMARDTACASIQAIMRILRHADVSMTMEIYANASSTATSEALRRLGESLR
jgi:integrase